MRGYSFFEICMSLVSSFIYSCLRQDPLRKPELITLLLNIVLFRIRHRILK